MKRKRELVLADNSRGGSAKVPKGYSITGTKFAIEQSKRGHVIRWAGHFDKRTARKMGLEGCMCHLCYVAAPNDHLSLKQVEAVRTSRIARAKALRDVGYSVRQTMRIMGFSHPGSVSYLLTYDNQGN